MLHRWHRSASYKRVSSFGHFLLRNGTARPTRPAPSVFDQGAWDLLRGELLGAEPTTCARVAVTLVCAE